MRKKTKKFIKKTGLQAFLVGLVLFFLVGGIGTIWASTLQIPDFDSFFQEQNLSQSTKIYDKTGKILLYDVAGKARRTVIPFDEMGEYVKEATISIEDSDFYNHNGIKITSIIRAFAINLASGEVTQGGSTLTQQVIKNTLLTKEKKISRKIKEAILSLKLERAMSKDDILSLYLNEAPYGGNIYGIEEVSQEFFQKPAKELTVAEAAYLASLPQAPTYLSPFGKNKDKLDARKNTTLKRMYDLGYINKEIYDQAKNEEVVFHPPEGNGIKAPHFVFYVIGQLSDDYSEEDLKTKGLRVITTLDWEIQKKAEELLVKYGEKNKRDFDANNAGFIAIDPKTGSILSMVGSVDYFDVENEGNFNVTTAKRQPGSAFKPFVYATAFMKGYTPETILFDLPTEFNTNCNPNGTPNTPGAVCYMPENYDGQYAGPITLRKSLGNSKNVTSVKLLYLTGINDVLNTAKLVGITSFTDPKRYGLSLVLGGGEVTLLELTNAYSVFANEGAYNKPKSIEKIVDSRNEVLKEYKNESKQVIDQNIARTISSVLDDDEARTPSFSINTLMNIPGYNIAAKTGTTNDYKDAWIIGYTPSITIGAWVGNNDNTPMDKKVAGQIVAPLWNEFMVDYLKNKPNEPFNPPNQTPLNIKPVLRGVWQSGDSYFVDSRTGDPADENTPKQYVEERFNSGVHSILYWVSKNTPTGPNPNRPENDPQFTLWETPVRNWAISHGFGGETTNFTPKPNPFLNTNNQNNIDSNLEIKINSIKKEAYTTNETVNISVSSDNDSQISQVDFFINNIYLSSTTKKPFTYTFIPKNISNIRNSNEVKVVVYDKNRNRFEEKSIVLVNES